MRLALGAVERSTVAFGAPRPPGGASAYRALISSKSGWTAEEKAATLRPCAAQEGTLRNPCDRNKLKAAAGEKAKAKAERKAQREAEAAARQKAARDAAAGREL